MLRTLFDTLYNMSPKQLTALLGKIKPEIVHHNAPNPAAAGNGREVWRTLAMTLLTLMSSARRP